MKIQFDWSAEHIWESCNGNLYANVTLLKKSKVTTKAQIQRIAHNHSENDEICLKIGRYRNVDDKPEIENPKSELTLGEEEFENLIEFIKKFYPPMEMGVDSFIPVDGSQLSDLLTKFKSIAADDSKKAQALLENGIINSDVSFMIEQAKRVESLKEFKRDLENPEFLEGHWQKWFQKRKWIIGSEFAAIIDDRRIDAGNIADYLVQSNDGFLDVVEIKKPNGLDFWMAYLDHNNYVPSSDLVKAITQCRNYLFEIERESDSRKFGERVGNTPIASPRCILIYGRSCDWNEKQQLAFRLLNATLNGITIITYDQLYQRAANMVGLNETMRTGEKNEQND